MTAKKSSDRLLATIGCLVTTLGLLSPGAVVAHGGPDISELPQGVVKASLTDPADIRGLHLTILDAPVPALLLRYEGSGTLHVPGSDGGPFLRFQRDRVEAHTDSPSWHAAATAAGKPTGTDRGHWQTVSGSGSFGWVDSRVAEAVRHAGADGKPVTWRIPVALENSSTASSLTGSVTWQPLPDPGGQ